MMILASNLIIALWCYGAIYPTMRPRTLAALIRGDLLMTSLALCMAGALFAGTGTRFDMLLFRVNWFCFALLTLAVIEAPLFMWFCRRYGIELKGERP
ncbi:hypothetical protein SAMN05421538_101263 [Paracoccus isoporae]|uniref:Uncharacterized protein n=2 Tax=Paracoccus isoporae TaxID=591205 RepID=A0A1G6TE94_9RHOB|nr:hypothetical protein SAMN05421538_101263 [Paracoccus isoporae]